MKTPCLTRPPAQRQGTTSAVTRRVYRSGGWARQPEQQGCAHPPLYRGQGDAARASLAGHDDAREQDGPTDGDPDHLIGYVSAAG